MSNEALEKCLIDLVDENTTERWNNVIKYLSKKLKVRWEIDSQQNLDLYEQNNQIGRCPILYQNPNLKSRYTDVIETYYCRFYEQIFKNCLNDKIFNCEISKVVNEIKRLRKKYKKRYFESGSTRYNKLQLSCKIWQNEFYSMVNSKESILKSFINYQDVICHIGRSIMSKILINIMKDGLIDHVIYMDTDCIVTQNLYVGNYFHSSEKNFDFNTQHIKEITFERNNSKLRVKTYDMSYNINKSNSET